MDSKEQVTKIAIEDIIPNRFQPREIFNEQALKELAVSIQEHGVIQPIIVRPLGNKYEIIAGERRYKATTMAGLKDIPAIVRTLDDKEASKVALLENLQRRDLTSIEEAKTYQTILNLDAMSQAELARTMGKSQASVSNKLRLLNLPEEVQQALLEEKISERHARALLRLENSSRQKELLKSIIDQRIPVRRLDEMIKEEIEKDEKENLNMNQNINNLFVPSNEIGLTDANTASKSMPMNNVTAAEPQNNQIPPLPEAAVNQLNNPSTQMMNNNLLNPTSFNNPFVVHNQNQEAVNVNPQVLDNPFTIKQAESITKSPFDIQEPQNQMPNMNNVNELNSPLNQPLTMFENNLSGPNLKEEPKVEIASLNNEYQVNNNTLYNQVMPQSPSFQKMPEPQQMLHTPSVSTPLPSIAKPQMAQSSISKNIETPNDSIKELIQSNDFRYAILAINNIAQDLANKGIMVGQDKKTFSDRLEITLTFKK